MKHIVLHGYDPRKKEREAIRGLLGVLAVSAAVFAGSLAWMIVNLPR